jgi:hypothetical protein
MQSITNKQVDILFREMDAHFPSEQKKKELGMAKAASNNNHMLVHFRSLAFLLLATPSEISIDDVRAYADKIGFQYIPGNWCGSVFNTKDFEWTGKMKKAEHVGSHGRLVKTWRRRS